MFEPAVSPEVGPRTYKRMCTCQPSWHNLGLYSRRCFRQHAPTLTLVMRRICQVNTYLSRQKALRNPPPVLSTSRTSDSLLSLVRCLDRVGLHADHGRAQSGSSKRGEGGCRGGCGAIAGAAHRAESAQSRRRRCRCGGWVPRGHPSGVYLCVPASVYLLCIHIVEWLDVSVVVSTAGPGSTWYAKARNSDHGFPESRLGDTWRTARSSCACRTSRKTRIHQCCWVLGFGLGFRVNPKPEPLGFGFMLWVNPKP